MKFIKRMVSIMCITTIVALSCTINCYADDIKPYNIPISAGQSQVAVGKTVSITITVPSNANSWVYSVSYSNNLVPVPSDKKMSVSGGYIGGNIDGDPRSVQFIFQANSIGAATVKISSGEIRISGTDYKAVGSVSVNVVAVSTPAPTPTPSKPSGNSGGSGTTKPTPTPDTRSSNCSLAAMTLSEGTLSPAFDSSVTEYSVNLTSKTTSINVDATPSDTKAAIAGAGDIAVQPGANTIKVVVTAENGTKKTYTITANVDEAPIVYTKFEDKSLGVVRNLRDVTIPEGFTETTTTLEGQEVKAWASEATGITLVYLVDEEENAAFYVYSPDKGVLCKYTTFQFNGQNYTFAGVDESLREQEGLTYGKVEAFGSAIDGFSFKDESLSSFVVLYLMNGNNEYGYYTYDNANQTLQRFSGAVYSAKGAAAIEAEKQALEQKLKREILIRNISLGAAAALAAAVAVLLYKLSTKDKKIRRLRRRGESQDIEA